MTAAVLLLVLVGSLVVYKSASALRQLDYARTTGSVATRAAFIPDDPTTLSVRVAARSLNYLDAVWPALAFGILISGAVRAFTPIAALSRFLDRGGVRSQLVAGASGAPLMLCSCCVAPIFSSVYDRSQRLAPSLALMIAAPALNPAALVLTFLLFPAPMAWARVWMSIGAVFVGTVLVARLAPGHLQRLASSRMKPVFSSPLEMSSPAGRGKTNTAAQRAGFPLQPALNSQGQRHLSDLVRFAQACAQVTLRTVPIILVGVVVAVLFADRVQLHAESLPSMRLVAIAVTALVALPIALPTFFEIPLATTLLASGAPVGAAAALLFVGPAINLPSLLTVGHAAGWKAAVLMATMVWLVAIAGGLSIG